MVINLYLKISNLNVHYFDSNRISKSLSYKIYNFTDMENNNSFLMNSNSFDKNIIEPGEIDDDDPERRIRETTLDIVEEELPLSKLRLKALDDAKKMPIDDEGSLQSTTEDYIYSQPTEQGKSNWLQIGPTSIPDGQSISTYYYWPGNLSTNVTGRITSIVIDPVDSNIIYVGTALGGIWKTIDGGRNWAAKSDYAPSLGIGVSLWILCIIIYYMQVQEKAI